MEERHPLGMGTGLHVDRMEARPAYLMPGRIPRVLLLVHGIYNQTDLDTDLTLLIPKEHAQALVTALQKVLPMVADEGEGHDPRHN